MARTPAKIVKVAIARKPGPWGGYKVRLITAAGAVVRSYDADRLDGAKSIGRSEARAHGAEFVGLVA